MISLARKLPDRSLKDLRDDLENSTGRGLHQLASLLVASPTAKVVVSIDQLEELFMDTTHEKERQFFIDLLVTAVTEPGGPVIILLTLRADFYDRPMRYPHFSRLMQAHHVSVLPMELANLRAVIEKPAQLHDVQMTFEGELVGDLLFEMRGQTGALPLLEFALDQLFQRRDHHRLTVKAFNDIGGVKGALTRHLEATYHGLPSEGHRKLARSLFLRLIDPGQTDQDIISHRAALSEFMLADPIQTDLLREIIDAFITARLVTSSENAGITTLEVSHEAVIREWPRLLEWLDQARNDVRLQLAISRNVEEWERHGKPKERLYRGDQLEEAMAWKERSLPSQDENTFLQISVAEQERQEATALGQQRRYKRRTVLMWLGVGVAGLGLTGLGIALNRKLPLPPLSLPYTLLGHTDVVNSVVWSPDSKLLASASADKTVRVWDATSGTALLTYRVHSDAVSSVAWSPDGKHLALTSDDTTVEVRDATTGTTLLTYGKHAGIPTGNSVAWSPDGKRLASTGYELAVQVWDAVTGATLLTYEGHSKQVYPPSEVVSVAWSPDGKYLATAINYTTVEVWDATTGTTLLIYKGHTNGANSVAWSPDSKRLASAGDDSTVQIWDATTGITLLTYISKANSVAWSSDGTHLASASVDKTVRLWLWLPS